MNKKITRSKLILVLFLQIFFLFPSKGCLSQELPRFKDGETVCFVGNSITQAGYYQMLVQAFYATRFPGNKVKFISCGIGGDLASDMIDRFDRDVLVHKPNHAFLMTGMNDMLSNLYLAKLTVTPELKKNRETTHLKYRKLTTELVQKMLINNIKPILMTPTIYDETAKLSTESLVGKNNALEICAKHIRSLGKKYKVPVVDLNPFMLEINSKAQKKDPSYTIISKDRIHPEKTGHFIMSHKIISTLFAKSFVSKIIIDGKTNKLLIAKNAQVKIDSTTKNLTFEVKANALPLPITEGFKAAQRLVPFQSQLNKETIIIKGLKKGKYSLKINNTIIKVCSEKDLKKGISLATNSLTPQYQQANAIFDLCEQYHEIQSQLRTIASVEFKMLKDYKGSDTMESKKEYLTKITQELLGKPRYNNVVKSCNLYYACKPQEENIIKELEAVRAKIYTKNIPVKQTYSLIKL